MNLGKALLVASAVGFIVAGCSSSEPLPSPSASTNTIAPTNDSVPSTRTTGLNDTSGLRFSTPFPGMQQGDLDLLNNNLIVYFEFDRSEIRPEFNQMLAAHGRYLVANPSESIRLEGHADERGSREYNIGLGERRAQAVRQILLLQGVSPSQLTTISYGEERPAVSGSDEEAYSLNRRVELVYP